MPYDKTIQVLEGGSVLAECGPMRLILFASVGRIPQPQMCARAAEESFLYLERIARFRGLLGQKYREALKEITEPLAIQMIESISAVGDTDLTPMAAVAGTIADAAADFLAGRGMIKVVVDNGGDIAIRLEGNETVTVGIRSKVGEKGISHVIRLDGSRNTWGVATSGLGGRSLTRGIATAATIVAANASLADAAATAVANASYVEDSEVIQSLAEEIDPYTDIQGLPVTVKVGPLSEEKKSMAVSKAIRRAEELVRRKVILGAFVAVQGKTATTDFMSKHLLNE